MVVVWIHVSKCKAATLTNSTLDAMPTCAQSLIRCKARWKDAVMTEEQNLQELKNTLTNLGYPVFTLKTYVQALYGKRIDLVVYEFDKPKIVFEVKERLKLPLDSRGDELRFHPSVRQAQSLAQEIGAPYFAVSDGSTILWFDIDREEGRPRLLERPVLPSTINHRGHQRRRWEKRGFTCDVDHV